MDFRKRLESEAMTQQIRQQVTLLKAKGKLHITKHVPGRAVIVEFEYDKEFMGSVLIKGEKYRMFKDAGGFEKITPEELMEIEERTAEEMENEKGDGIHGKNGNEEEGESRTNDYGRSNQRRDSQGTGSVPKQDRDTKKEDSASGSDDGGSEDDSEGEPEAESSDGKADNTAN